jgi:spermidine/putrescine transport system permease protein
VAIVNTMSRSWPTALITGLVMVFLFVPLLLVVLFSFHSTGSLTLPFEGFSLQWYDRVLGSVEFRTAFENSLIIATTTSAATLVIGTMAAYGVSRSRSRWRAPLMFLFLVPLALPGLFLGVALLSFFGRIQLELSLLTVFAAHFIFSFPFFFVLARIALERMDPSLEEAAQDLGASPWLVFRRVTLPQIWPVLLAATALVFVLSFDEFVITFFVVGGEQTLPVYIFGRLRRTVDPTINVVSTLLLLVSVAALVLAYCATWAAARRRGSGQLITGGGR